jgi:hypothetical protein
MLVPGFNLNKFVHGLAEREKMVLVGELQQPD